MNRDDNPLIELRAINRIYETEVVETRALADVSLCIRAGEFVSVSGPSGSGKSTLLSIMGLLDQATSGEYLLMGRDVTSLERKESARIRNTEIGFIFQNFNLIGELTVLENVELPLFYRGFGSDKRREIAERYLQKVEMSHRMSHYPSQLSGGQQQRVAVARALSGEPRVLLADEPTGNLDSENGNAVMELLKSLHEEGSTICMVTHNDAFNAYASRLVPMLDGRIQTRDKDA